MEQQRCGNWSTVLKTVVREDFSVETSLEQNNDEKEGSMEISGIEMISIVIDKERSTCPFCRAELLS